MKRRLFFAMGGIALVVWLSGCMNQSDSAKQDVLLQADARAMPKRKIHRHKRIRDFLAKHPVYLSMTSSPSRIQHITAVLDSIEQEYVTNIVLNIPETYARTGERYEIPRALQSYPKLVLNHIPEDYGPISKVLPTIEWALRQDPEAIVIAVDDDIAYPAGMVNEHLYALVEQGHAVSAANIRKLAERWSIDQANIKKWPDTHYDIVQGFASIAYRAKDFPSSLMRGWLAKEKQEGQKNCFLSDDLVISYGLAYAGVSAHKVTTPYLANKAVKMLSFSRDKGAISQTDIQHGGENPNDARLIACYHFLSKLAR